jgi:hypothetical protein
MAAVGTPTHLAFSDESHYNVGRYRGIGLVTLGATDYDQFNSELCQLLADSGIREFKWNELRTAQDRFAALKLTDWALQKLLVALIRIDVLTWDTQDTRHNVRSRDDVANLQRMYYHLFKNVLRNRWPDGSRWKLFPDEHSAIDWDEMDKYLDRSSMSSSLQRGLGENPGWRLTIRTEFRIHQISQCHSHEQPLVQLADLFAGLGVYSRAQYDCFAAWHASRDPQTSFFTESQPQRNISKADGERCLVLSHLDDGCKRLKLQVSFKSQRGLRTRNPASALNFWWYEPQVQEDKAPTRTRR